MMVDYSVSRQDSELQSQSSYSVYSVLSLIYLGAFPTALAFLIRFYIISKAGPIFLSYVAYLIPVFAIIWGFIFLGEKISTHTFFGVALAVEQKINKFNFVYNAGIDPAKIVGTGQQ